MERIDYRQSFVSAIQKGNISAQNQRYDEAIRSYEQALKEHPQLEQQIKFCIEYCKAKLKNYGISAKPSLVQSHQERKEAPDFCSENLYKHWKEDKHKYMQQKMLLSLIADHALFSIIIDFRESCQYSLLLETISCLSKQDYGNIELIVLVDESLRDYTMRISSIYKDQLLRKRGLTIEVIDRNQDDPASIRDSIRRARGSYIMLLNPGSILHFSLFSVINFFLQQAIHAGPVNLILIDYEEFDETTGNTTPYCYEGWDPDFLSSYGVQPETLVFSKKILTDVLANEDTNIQRVILNALKNLKPGDPTVLLVPEPLIQINLRNKISIYKFQIRAQILEPLSIIIPNKDSPDLLIRCLAFAIQQGENFEHEIIIVDNASMHEDTRLLYEDLRRYPWIKIIQGPSSFNYSVLVNQGAHAAKNKIILLLNNDVEIPSLDSLQEARINIQRTEVGVVGLVLMYPNHLIQHAGISLSHDIKAMHILRNAQMPYRSSVRRYLKHVRNVQAVTGACMLVKKSDYERVGGHNEIDLPVEFNDVDFCLKIRESNLRVLCVPSDNIIHHESYSRGKQASDAVINMRHQATSYMRRCWKKYFIKDAFQGQNIGINDCSVPYLRDPENFSQRYHVPEDSQQTNDGHKRVSTTVSEEMIKEIVFNAEWYLDAYSDVKECGIDAYQHYMSAGWKEGRLPSEDFLIYQYKERYKGVDLLNKNVIIDICERVSRGELLLEHVHTFRANIHRSRPILSYLENSIAVYGYLTSEIGLGQAARTLCSSLDELRISSTFHAYSIPGRENDNEYKSKLSSVNRSRVALAMLPLNEPKILEKNIYPGRYNILYGVWELLLPPSDSIPIIRRFDGIWVPSSFVQKCLHSEGLNSTVIPHAIPICDRYKALIDSKIKNDQIFTVLVFLDFDSYFTRKNPLAAIEAFRLAFQCEKDVELIIKVRGTGSSQDRLKLSALIQNQSRVKLLDQTLTRDDMDRLIASCDCFLSLHRSEGFGFGCAEALALGKIVIATDFGGTTDFINMHTAYPVSYNLIPVKEGDYAHYELGQTWADPSIEDAATILQNVYTNRAEAYVRANYGRSFMLANFSITAVAAKIQMWFTSKGLALNGN